MVIGIIILFYYYYNSRCMVDTDAVMSRMRTTLIHLSASSWMIFD